MANKSERTYQERAEAEVKNIRGLMKRQEVSEGQEATLRVELARVYATLELADAIRGRTNGDQTNGDS